MDTGFEKLFVKRGHPSDAVIDGELFHVLSKVPFNSHILYIVDLFKIPINFYKSFVFI